MKSLIDQSTITVKPQHAEVPAVSSPRALMTAESNRGKQAAQISCSSADC
jgi:hypothetical protein